MLSDLIQQEILNKPIRHFLPGNISFDAWKNIEFFFDDLLKFNINNEEDLLNWLRYRSELEAAIEEEGAWRYIRTTINTKDEKAAASYNFFITEIEPHIAKFTDKLNRKLIQSTGFEPLSDKQGFNIYFRSVKNSLKLYREENVELHAKISSLSQTYGAITGAQYIEYNEQKLTMPQAAVYLKSTNRDIRELIYLKMTETRLKDADKLDNLFNELLKLRHQIALNAGYKNYRDYMFDALGRFDYTKEDCFKFHESIKTEILPVIKEFAIYRKKVLGYDVLKPWDVEVDIAGKNPLKPFKNSEDLIERSIRVFAKIYPYFGKCLAVMKEMKRLDLDSKDGKAPGGYNYPLYETVAPFIFMNAAGTQQDMITMMHEGGHAVHSFLSNNLELTAFKSTPSEIAELASMSMELMSMDYWDIFYPDNDDLKRAKLDQLEKILSILPWIAIVDKFQHWIYENPFHTIEQRNNKWKEILDEFSTGIIDYSGLEDALKKSWHKQLHIFEVPFYYIEYGMAQLGAIALWRNYLIDKDKTVKKYAEALSLGYTKSIPEIYNTAGINFDFTSNYVKDIAAFVSSQINKIKSS